MYTKVLALALSAIALGAELAHADVVTEWNEATLDVIRARNTPPPAAARNLAMVHVAIYDAVNGILRTHEQLPCQRTRSCERLHRGRGDDLRPHRTRSALPRRSGHVREH